ncbi:hypothetical protein MTO96_031466 [Rhipicephalus appendiculatus]
MFNSIQNVHRLQAYHQPLRLPACQIWWRRVAELRTPLPATTQPSVTPLVNPEDVKLIGRRLRYISDSFDWRSSVSRRNDQVVIHDWFTDFLTACVSSVMEWWKTAT